MPKNWYRNANTADYYSVLNKAQKVFWVDGSWFWVMHRDFSIRQGAMLISIDEAKEKGDAMIKAIEADLQTIADTNHFPDPFGMAVHHSTWLNFREPVAIHTMCELPGDWVNNIGNLQLKEVFQNLGYVDRDPSKGNDNKIYYLPKQKAPVAKADPNDIFSEVAKQV